MSSASLEAIFGALTSEGRGFVLGATLLGLDEDAAARLTAPEGDRCAAALRSLGSLPREGKAARLGQLARELGAPYPLGLENVHASWIRKVLAAEPSEMLAAMVAGAPPSVREAAADLVQARAREGARPPDNVVLVPEMATELRRLAFVALVMSTPEAAAALAPLLELPPRELLFEVRRLGARSLGASLSTAPVDIRARAMAGVGTALAEDLRIAANTSDRATRHEGEADVKAASAESAAGGTVEERLELIGISALERLLTGAALDVRRALAVRLPARLGRKLLPAGAHFGEAA